MKSFSFIMLALCLLSACAKQTAKGPAVTSVPTVPATPAKTQVSLPANQKDSISYAIGVSMGSTLRNQNLDTLNMDMLVKGLNGAVGKDSLLFDEATANMFLMNYFQNLQRQAGEKQKRVGEKFLEENKAKPGVKTTASGLQYQVLKEGNGARPTSKDRVTVHYAGTTIDGKQFDNSYERGSPATFEVEGVIPGWTEGLQLMKVGSKYRFFIPPALAYGETGSGPKIPPYSVLIFDVELLGVEKAK